MKVAVFILLLTAFFGEKVFAQPDIEERRRGKNRKAIPAIPPPVKTNPTTPNNGTVNVPVPSAARTVTGIVKDRETGEGLPGAYIQIEGTIAGTVTDDNGNFTLELPTGANTLISTYTGYSRTITVILPNMTKVTVELKEEILMTETVVITASRVSEKLMESPVTIEKLDLRALRETPNLNAYDAVAYLKGVDLMSASMGFRVINSRGFNSLTNQRFIHRLDGMDLQAPGLNIPINVLNGASDLDVESIELVPGASSALYGPNAFNGLLEVMTKSPFVHKGLSASVKIGANHLDGIDHPTAPFYDFTARYATTFKKDKFGVKGNISYFRATDWYATDFRDAGNYAGSDNLRLFGNPGIGNPGYDGLNKYGDEIANTFRPQDTQLPGLPVPLIDHNLRIARTGYREQDISNYNTYNFKGDLALHWRPSTKTEVILSSRLSTGTAVYQSVNRYNLQNFLFGITKAEVKGSQFFLRGYVSYENAGGTYDTRFTGINLNQAYKANDNWFLQYLAAYSPVTNPILNSVLPAFGRNPVRPMNDADARAFAESDNRALYPAIFQFARSLNPADTAGVGAAAIASLLTGGNARLQPGTPEFNEAKNRINSNPDLSNGGALFIDRTSLWHTEGQYDFSKLITWAEITAGGNIRMYNLNSEGSIFPDTSGRKIRVWEYGGYVQATKRFFDKRLRLTASGRLDKSTNFDVYFSPRVAAVVTMGKKRNHNIRASFQRGFRNPTLQNQYLNLNIGTIRYIGGLEEEYQSYFLKMRDREGREFVNAYDEGSVDRFLATGDSTQLVKAPLNRLRPEDTRSFEIGYKANITEDFFVDLGYYANWYRDFIVVQSLVTANVINKNYGPDGDPRLTLDDLRSSERSLRVRRTTNLNETVVTHGFNIGLSYVLSNKFTLSANYSFTKILTDNPNRSRYIIGFNTPEHKTNLSFSGRNLGPGKRFGFAVQHRWVDGMIFEETVFRGFLPAYNLVDAQVSFKMPSYKTILQLGGTNILNNRHLEALVSSTIGAMVYIRLTYDPSQF